MKKLLFLQKALFLGLIIAINLIYLPKIQAEEIILEPLDLILINFFPSDNTAKIIWNTNYATYGKVKYGLTTQFGSFVETYTPTDEHETWLSGLQPDQTYYFTLDIYDIYDRHFTSSHYSFKTIEVNDTNSPILTDIHTSYVTGNTATFVWYTNEWASTCVFYSTNISNLDKYACNNKMALVHDITIGDLTRNTTYYYRTYSEDSSDNGAFSVYYNFKTNYYNDVNIPDLEIHQSTFVAENDELDRSTAVITFLTNRPVSGYLRWGDTPSSYPHQIELPLPKATTNEIVISDLDPGKNYYYSIDITDVFSNHIITPEYVLFTPAIDADLPTTSDNVDYNPNDPNQDFDQDGLTNGAENYWGTSPIKSDSDGDGYPDGVEVSNCYNPLGIGKLSLCNPGIVGSNIFAYNQPRVSNLQIEVNAANEIRSELENYFGGPFYVTPSGWYKLVNAYVYGGYPIEAIYKAVVHSGKTVHPEIPWNLWYYSDDYQE